MFEFQTSTIFASVIWGGLGTGIFIYGWRQKSAIPLAAGVLMVGITYFIGSALWMSLAGVLILAAMIWAIRRGY